VKKRGGKVMGAAELNFSVGWIARDLD